MGSQNPRALIGANNPPDPIDEITAPFDASRQEAENWLDGQAVKTEAQMDAVDALRKEARKWRLALEAGQKTATAPLYAVYTAELDRWKPTIADAKMIETGLVALVDGFKRQLAAEKEAARKAAWEAAEAARREAEAKMAMADVANIEAQREAKAAMEAAEIARAQAAVAQKDTVKGLRWYDLHEILDLRGALHWIAANDKPAMTAFVQDYVAKNAKAFPPEIVRNYREQRAV